MVRTSSITMMGIMGRVPAVDKQNNMMFFSGTPARSAAMPVLFLLGGPKIGYSPRKGDTFTR